MQNFLVVVIAKGNVLHFNPVIVKGNGLRTMCLFLRLQDLVYLSHCGAHLRQRIHKVEGRYNGAAIPSARMMTVTKVSAEREPCV